MIKIALFSYSISKACFHDYTLNSYVQLQDNTKFAHVIREDD
jgi:hypothetical protein